MEEQYQLRQFITIDANPSDVWEALINRSLTKEYMFGCEARSDWKPGHEIRYIEARNGGGKEHVKGTILDYQPGSLLQFTAWSPHFGWIDTEENYVRVTVQMINLGGKAQVSVTLDQLTIDRETGRRAEMAIQDILQGLKNIVEKR